MKTSIIILTYNQLNYTKQCINSIYNYTNKDDIEVIVVDNGSTDGTKEYLNKLTEIKKIYNNKNLGFSKGCNQGMSAAKYDNILFLNNDTIVTKNWLTAMLRELHSDESVGMVGPVSNNVSGEQQINVTYQDIHDLDDFAELYCNKQKNKSKYVLRLVGFCLLAKREILDEIGNFDEYFEYGSFEDDDLCLRALLKGYHLKIALDSFVHHHGHATFMGNQELNVYELYRKNYLKFLDKWNFDWSYYIHPRPEIVDLVPSQAKMILDVGCGAGATGISIMNRQHCEMYGIELNQISASIAKNYYKKVFISDVENIKLPIEEESLDVIIFADILEHLKDPWSTVIRFSKYLKRSGVIVCSVPNVLHAEALLPLLQGSWSYTNAGILDRTHLRFFTLDTINTLFPKKLFEIEEIKYNYLNVEPKIKLFFQEVAHLAAKFGISVNQLSNQIEIYQILVKSKKVLIDD
ncbi:glycosyltransferase [Bacillus ginsengihumi]|uniref:Glycosyltransferase n=1 Tax=Heyndrickxia ginsengihumi TaxID=363870 RepID=A0A6M0PAR3_9BACI|nr:glycosyltransferase [Heyndrickxia ginsengihumi]NEY21475.1 glycosyltransferase [Heyndrickxia ginsengihumi]